MASDDDTKPELPVAQKTIDDAVALLDSHFHSYPNRRIQDAWKQVRASARSAKRLSSRTMPRIAGLAQHAVAVRDAISLFLPALPPTLYQTAEIALDHVSVMIEALRTGRESEPPDPMPDE